VVVVMVVISFDVVLWTVFLVVVLAIHHVGRHILMQHSRDDLNAHHTTHEACY
jgi:hypothetical protein